MEPKSQRQLNVCVEQSLTKDLAHDSNSVSPKNTNLRRSNSINSGNNTVKHQEPTIVQSQPLTHEQVELKNDSNQNSQGFKGRPVIKDYYIKKQNSRFKAK